MDLTRGDIRFRFFSNPMYVFALAQASHVTPMAHVSFPLVPSLQVTDYDPNVNPFVDPDRALNSESTADPEKKQEVTVRDRCSSSGDALVCANSPLAFDTASHRECST